MIELNGINWVTYHGALIPDCAPHREITVSKADEKYLLRRSGARFLRWTSGWDSAVPTDFWYVIKDQRAATEPYCSNTRRYVKRGLRLFSVRKVGSAEIAERGYNAYRQAFIRYETVLHPQTELEFKKDCESHRPGTDYWAVYRAQEMVGFAVNHTRTDMCEYSVMKYHPDHLKDACAFALIHTMNEYYLDHLKLRYVTDGTRCLSHATRIQDFLREHFGFRNAFCRLHVAYAPPIQALVGVAFPLRYFVYRIPIKWFKLLTVLLKHEEIKRRLPCSRPPTRARLVGAGESCDPVGNSCP